MFNPFALHVFSENNTMHVGKIGLNSRRCALPLKVYILFVNAQTNLKIYLIFLYYFKFNFLIYFQRLLLIKTNIYLTLFVCVYIIPAVNFVFNYQSRTNKIEHLDILDKKLTFLIII